ncbi:hypothetical protein [Lysinibacillus cavernae]|uniref:hypothetical protein n=1 Tax=Lysinibacillus cavernae TaxID=2666135 RepID=UPI0018C24C73|nr:hypothetical protein [Lysinibacillus cavernae]
MALAKPSIDHLKKGNVRILGGDHLTKGKQYKRQSELAELSTDLSPDDLDVREDNALTQEQKKNASEGNRSKKSSARKSES